MCSLKVLLKQKLTQSHLKEHVKPLDQNLDQNLKNLDQNLKPNQNLDTEEPIHIPNRLSVVRCVHIVFLCQVASQ